MGNNKFKFSDMIPNAWFYKLKDMSKSSRKRNGSQSHHVMKNKVMTSPTTSQRSQQYSRYSSHHFSNEQTKAYNKILNSPIHTKDLNLPFNDSPRKSSKRKTRRKTIYKPSQHDDDDLSSIENSSSESYHNQCVSSESEFCDSFSVPDLLNCSCRVSSSTNDIIIDMNNESFQGNSKYLDGFDAFSQHGLAPILTKQVKFDDKIESRSSTESEENINRTQRRRKKSQIGKKGSPNSQGIKLRVNSPKLVNKKIQAYGRKSVSSSLSSGSKVSRNDGGFVDGFAVVKSSIDPISDFKESMVEMIVENNIRGSKDLENLLACYLSLNSSEYHDVIVKAFEQIWYDMAQLRM
ncbi:transcription repressor OFP3-like [Trifolium pratense]|uniref:transcription repressor OFP3-like n=1 Tax=Trifolium pratense TaxID=57577 RepID=UPI001E693595|nr:transcription repressor OFP3-like [Trifolium pratense]